MMRRLCRALAGVALVVAAVVVVIGCRDGQRRTTPGNEQPARTAVRLPEEEAFRAVIRWWDQGEYEKYLVTARAYLRMYPKEMNFRPCVIYYVAKSHERLGQIEEALSAHEEVLATFPQTQWGDWSSEDALRLSLQLRDTEVPVEEGAVTASDG